MKILLLRVLCFLFMTTEFTEANDETKQRNSTRKNNHVYKFFMNAMPEDYDAHEVPSQVAVMAAIAIISIASVEFSRSEIEVEFVFIAAWKDNRLTFGKSAEEMAAKHRLVLVPDNVKNLLWVPWILFSECKQCQTGWATGEQPRALYFSPIGELFMIYFRDNMLFSCQYDLTFYPFDAHECRISLEFVDISFGNRSVQLKDGYQLLFQHSMENVTSPGMPSEFYFVSLFAKQVCCGKTVGLVTPDEQCLQYGFRFHRIAAYYLMLIYTPSFTIVLVSWISFWLEVNNPVPRVTLGLTSLLTLTTQFSNAQDDLPPVAYIKALDVWMITCVIMVFASLLEFIFAYIQLPALQKAKPTLQVKETSRPTGTVAMKERNVPVDVKKMRNANWLDVRARVVFPVVFAVFNIVYWPYYARTG